MKTINKSIITHLIQLALFISGPIAVADDIREKVISSEAVQLPSPVIVPDESLFGVPYGTTEDEFITKVGPPTGYIRLSKDESALLYGKAHLFIFTNDALSGVYVHPSLFRWRASNRISMFTAFDRFQWKLDNGIGEGTNLREVKEVIENYHSERPYAMSFTTENALVDLNFVHAVSMGDGDEAYSLAGLYIRLK